MNRVVLVVVALVSAGLAGGGSVQAEGDPQAGQDKSMVCASCHGADGNSTSPLWPKLAGQNGAYLMSQIKAFREGTRKDPSMAPMVASLSAADIADLASYFESQTGHSGSGDISTEAAGRRLYRAGDAAQGVPACMSCHGPAGEGNGPAGWPALAGQHPDYLVKQLQAYKSGSRSGGQGGMMAVITKGLSEDDMVAVARYINLLQRPVAGEE
ncbi:MAG: cytochrome c4 [Gammaproteobacteria bacterium]|nr:cytochrome c4 [Gammaproteobacteria bacterium]